MDKFIIRGGTKLKGEIRAGGSKNTALPIIAASLLAEGETILHNCPNVSDVVYMLKVLEMLGAEVKFSRNICRIKVPAKTGHIAPYDIVRKMRASYYVMGSLLGRTGKVDVSLPGGCAIGERPMDLHLKGFSELGCTVKLEHGNMKARARKMRGKEIFLEGKHGTSVGATINVMMAACRAEGKTLIKGAAIEPEVGETAAFLNSMGADISGIDTPVLEINGVSNMNPAEFTVTPDRIESGTLLAAVSITGGDAVLTNTCPAHMKAVLEKFREAGDKLKVEKDSIHIKAAGIKKPVNIDVLPYPLFPTDMQAQFTSLLSISSGISVVTDNVFEKRFMHVPELKRMGADIDMKDNSAVIKGVKKLSGAPVMASDLRASAALVIAGLVAGGETEIKRIYHIDRGYERIEKKLRKLGAYIRRTRE